MTSRFVPWLLLLGVVWPGGVRSAYAQDESRQDIEVQNQILELRHDVETLRDQVAAGGGQARMPAPQYARGSEAGPPASGDTAAMLLDRVSQLEDTARSLQGSVDELRNTLQRQNADQTKQLGDLSFRIQALEGGAGTAVSAGPAPDGGPTPAPRPGGTPVLRPPLMQPSAVPAHATLQQGYAALARRDYPTAEAAARDTLAVPHAPRAVDAQFLLAQSLAGQHNFQQAALAYDDAYGKQRRGPHAPDALLGLANSLAALGEKPAACATLDKLHAEFPSPRADIRASAGAIGRRAGCH